MNSAIQLCQSPLPVAPSGRLFSARRVHVSLISHGSLSSVSKPSHLVSSSIFHRFAEVEREKKKKKNMVSGGSLRMACSGLGGKMKQKATMLACAGDDEYSNPEAEEGSVTGPLKKLMAPGLFESEPDDNEIEALKLYAMALSRDDPKGAQEIVIKEQQKWAAGEADDKLLMALVELLVYQEDYDEASRKLKDLREVVKADKALGTDFMHARWKKYYLLKAFVESVNEARQKIEPKETQDGGMEIEIEDEDEDDTDKPKEELWLIYCRTNKYIHR